MHRVALRTPIAAAASALALTAAVGLAPSPAIGAPAGRVTVTPLIADQPGVAPLTDSAVVNPWGESFGSTTPLWVANNGTDSTRLYRGAVDGSPVTKVPLEIAIDAGSPTGTVFNGGAGFVIRQHDQAAPARFIFAGEDGNVTGWAPTVAGGAMTVGGRTLPDSGLKGLAIATTNGRSWLYVADFHNNRIVVLDDMWHVVNTHGAFTDHNLPEGYAPFNVQVLGDSLYVTYAKQDADAADEVPGPGFGFVDAYTLHGTLVRRLVSRGALNAPWGLTIAPSSFGRLAGALLVGNFGDGHIHAYNRATGAFLATLTTSAGEPVEIDGLWALAVGNGVFGGTDQLIYTAGSDDEAHGQVGVITPLR